MGQGKDFRGDSCCVSTGCSFCSSVVVIVLGVGCGCVNATASTINSFCASTSNGPLSTLRGETAGGDHVTYLGRDAGFSIMSYAKKILKDWINQNLLVVSNRVFGF